LKDKNRPHSYIDASLSRIYKGLDFESETSKNFGIKVKNNLEVKKIHVMKVLWRSSQIKEETWERELEMRKKHPKLFLDAGMEFNFKDKFCFFFLRKNVKP
jgi:histidinol phosphatase-like enzyme